MDYYDLMMYNMDTCFVFYFLSFLEKKQRVKFLNCK